MIDLEPERGWLLPSPLRVTNIALGDVTLDVEVAHNLNPGPVTEADRPVVVSVSNLRRSDGEPLGSRPIRLDLGKLAVGAVLWHLPTVVFEHTGGVWVGTGARGWRQEARVVRSMVAAFAMKRLPAEFDEWLISVWREVHERPGAQLDLADELEVDVEWLANRLYRLRGKYGADRVPKGRRGNPGRNDEGR